MAKYRKKPVEIEAMQLHATVESCNHVLAWIGQNGGHATRVNAQRSDQGLTISTLEGDMLARPDDFVIRGVQGEFYPCRADIFAATYEAVAS